MVKSLSQLLLLLCFVLTLSQSGFGATLEQDFAYLITVCKHLETNLRNKYPCSDDIYISHTLSLLQRKITEGKDTLAKNEQRQLHSLLKALKRHLNFATVYGDRDRDTDALTLYGKAASVVDDTLGNLIATKTVERGLRKRVVKWANEAVGVSSPLYGVKTHISITAHPDYPDMFPGYLSCARVCSAILKKAGAGKGIHSACLRLDKALSGWKKVKTDDLSKGDVVFWAKNAQDFRPRHVGIHIGWFMGLSFTVDNNSLLGRVVKRPMSRPEWNLYHGRRTPK